MKRLLFKRNHRFQFQSTSLLLVVLKQHVRFTHLHRFKLDAEVERRLGSVLFFSRYVQQFIKPCQIRQSVWARQRSLSMRKKAIERKKWWGEEKSPVSVCCRMFLCTETCRGSGENEEYSWTWQSRTESDEWQTGKATGSRSFPSKQ